MIDRTTRFSIATAVKSKKTEEVTDQGATETFFLHTPTYSNPVFWRTPSVIDNLIRSMSAIYSNY